MDREGSTHPYSLSSHKIHPHVRINTNQQQPIAPLAVLQITRDLYAVAIHKDSVFRRSISFQLKRRATLAEFGLEFARTRILGGW
jgi:hypothetical protein